MLHVVYANAIESLTERLLERLYEGGPADSQTHDVFRPATLLVPNRNMEVYLRQQIARRRGVAAGIECLFLRGYLAGLLTRAAPDLCILEKEELRLSILAHLTGQGLERDGLHELSGYLAGGAAGPEPTEDDAPAVALRRFQLADRLSDIYLEYSFSRPDWLRAWELGRPVLGEHSDETVRRTEAWQQQFWQRLRADRVSGADRWLLLTEAWAEAERHLRGNPSDLFPGGLALDGPPLYVFGLSYMAPAFHAILQTLGNLRPVHVYTLNPSAEFWEDAESFGEANRRMRQWTRRASSRRKPTDDSDDPFGLLAEDENPPLRLWGRPGRENIRLLNEGTGYEFESRFRDPVAGGPPTLLRLLQQDILLRRPERRELPLGPEARASLERDSSVRFLACPGLVREVEIVADEIWRLLRDPAHAGLRMHDIAVIVNGADRDTYFTHIASTFEDFHGLRCSIVDRPLVGESRVGEALELLLDLPLGRFGRNDLLRLLTHPVFTGRYPDDPAAHWRAWAERLNVIFGADAADLQGTYMAEEDHVSWEQALRRLVTGVFAAGPASGQEEPLDVGYGPLLVEDVADGDVEAAAQLLTAARSLMADARWAKEQRRTPSEWGAWFAAVTSTYLAGADRSDRAVISRCVQALRESGERALPPDADAPVPYRIARELAREALTGLQGRGHYLSDGIVVSSFLPMRAIPFRAIFVLGLGDGRFPAGERRDPLDLRPASRRPGDVTRREQDKYMFLETLLSARERIYLSWVCRDAASGEELAPSTVVQELLHVLETMYLSPGEALPPEHRRVNRLTERHPLARYDARYFEPDADGRAALTATQLPEAVRERGAGLLRERLKQHLGSGSLPPAPARLLEAVREGAQADTFHRLLGLAPPIPPPPAEARGRRALTLNQLRDFAACPLQGSAKIYLGMRDDTEQDMLLVEDECFDAEPHRHALWLQEIFVAAGGDLERAAMEYDRRYTALKLRGELPAGPFARGQRARHLEIFRDWRAHLDEMEIGALDGYRQFRFGHAEEFASDAVVYDPVPLRPGHSVDGPPGGIQLSGTSAWMSPDNTVCLQLLSRGACKDPVDFFRGWLTLQALALLPGIRLPDEVTVVACSRKPASRKAPARRSYRVPAPAEARSRLERLAADALSRVHDYLFPLEAAVPVARRLESDPAATDLREFVLEALAGDNHSSQYGPVRRYDRFDPPDEAACRVYAERVAPFVRDERSRETPAEQEEAS